MPYPLIIIPTLDEADNIAILLRKILKLYDYVHILVVDGNSTDGTAEIVEQISNQTPYVKLISQPPNASFGDAIITGFDYALKGKYDPIITMDGDLSHDPEQLKFLMEKDTKYDMIIGSRYIDGIRVEGWQFRKLVSSKLANIYISYVLVRPLWDFTSGFRLYRKRFLERIDINKLEEKAYILQIQLAYLAYKNKCRVKEIPIVFHDRYPGRSKVLKDSFIKTMFQVLKYRAPISEIFRHLVYIKRDYRHFVSEYEELVNPPDLKKNIRIEKKESYSISIGVMAYNEEQIIGRCLAALQAQKLERHTINEILVISSGSTDRTDEIVQEIADKDSRIKLITQTRRQGKASAINEFLSRANGDIVVIESADTIVEKQTIQNLIDPFKDKSIGMTGVHTIPVNENNTMVGFFVNKLWQLHHMMAMDQPKCGEMIAFRNVINSIPNYTAVDEAVIEAIISSLKLKLAYAPEAILHNKGPETIKDFILQRKRITSGHLHLKYTMGYTVSTMDSKKIFSYVLKSQKWNIKDVVRMTFLMLLEAYARFAGKIDFYFRHKNPFIWDISKSTKNI